jgi:hypothetical protein
MAERLAPLVVAALLAGCAMPPPKVPVEHRRVVAAAPFDVRARVAQKLGELGLVPARGLTAEGPLHVGPFVAREAWADCRSILVEDDTQQVKRMSWARPQARQGELSVALVPSGGGTAVDVSARFSATYLDRYRNTPFSEPCTSTGVLERELLDAAG